MNEQEWREFLKSSLPLIGLKLFWGQKNDNQILPVPNSDEKMQFGDLRIETDKRTVVIGVESAGGIDNFLQYWPYLSGQTNLKPENYFILVYVYDSSYPTPKALWWFYRGRMPSLMVNIVFLSKP